MELAYGRHCTFKQTTLAFNNSNRKFKMTKKTAEGKEPDPCSFRVGDVWESPRGTIYKCTEEYFSGSAATGGPRRGVKKVVLRVGEDGSGKRVVRDWDAVGSISGGQFWVRHSWGGN